MWHRLRSVKGMSVKKWVVWYLLTRSLSMSKLFCLLKAWLDEIEEVRRWGSLTTARSVFPPRLECYCFKESKTYRSTTSNNFRTGFHKHSPPLPFRKCRSTTYNISGGSPTFLIWRPWNTGMHTRQQMLLSTPIKYAWDLYRPLPPTSHSSPSPRASPPK